MKLVIPDIPPGLILRFVDAVPLEDFFGWAHGIMGDVGPDSTLAQTQTENGWPLFLTRTAAGGVAALYRFHEFAAAVVIDTPPDPADLDALRELLARARPDWRGDEAISLAEMWDE